MKKILFVLCLGLVGFGYGQCISGDCENGQGTYTFASGSKYVGEWKDGNMDGQGTYTTDSAYGRGVKYVGQWKDDKMHGQGTKTYVEENYEGLIITYSEVEYIGEWKDGKKDGQGTKTYSNGEKYVGQWKDDKMHGQGTHTYTYTDGKKNGQGTYSWFNAKYVGEWKDGKKDGQGTKTWGNGDKYVGEWKDGNEHGQGTFTCNGSTYVGEYNDGKCHGQGTFTWPNGDKYVGEHKDGNEHGQGTKTYANGTISYKGLWKYSVPVKCISGNCNNGRGTMLFINSESKYINSESKYTGEFKDDNFHGQGTITFANGAKHAKYVGEWRDDYFNGQGTWAATNGDKYVGEWKDGKKDGQGTLTDSNGTVLHKGLWENDKESYINKDAEFPLGQQKMYEYLSKNIVYPEMAKENGIQGKVYVQFVVLKDGTIEDVKVVKSAVPSEILEGAKNDSIIDYKTLIMAYKTLDKEAIRLIKSMPKWKPAKQRGKAVISRFTLPINFRLT